MTKKLHKNNEYIYIYIYVAGINRIYLYCFSVETFYDLQHKAGKHIIKTIDWVLQSFSQVSILASIGLPTALQSENAQTPSYFTISCSALLLSLFFLATSFSFICTLPIASKSTLQLATKFQA